MNNKKAADLTDRYLPHLHQGAKALTPKYARELRHRETEAEEKLWSLLRNRQLKGTKFRRQHAIASYVVDFYCNESRLVIELDGDYHREVRAKEYDNSRTVLRKEQGITVLRFWNSELVNDPDKVLQKISEHLH